MGRPSSICVGQEFFRLTVVRKVYIFENGYRRLKWECSCVCGGTTLVTESKLTGKHTTSCGCYHRERQREVSKTHGMSRSSEFSIWQGLRKRCENRRSRCWDRYGGRGIKVCKRWLKFENFYADMGPRPSPKHMIERNDNDGDYEPSNCKWATNKGQSNNRSNNHRLTIDGVTKNLTQWSEEPGAVNRGTILTRIRQLGWEPKQAVFTPKDATRFGNQNARKY